VSFTWLPEDAPAPAPVGPVGWLRAGLRAGVIAATMLAGLVVLLLLRAVERPVCGLDRPVTPFIAQGFFRLGLAVMGIRFSSRGRPMRRPGAVVANHASWLDIFALNARKRVYFVSKSEVARWPVIGFLARAVGTVFIARDRRRAREQTALFEARLKAGHKLLFFPEGTSTDGMRVLPFKSTLFAAFFADGLREMMHLQPVTVVYHAPRGQDPRFYAWWGDMGFGGHALQVLAARRQGAVEVVYHAPVAVADFDSRKALAAHLEERVRAGMPPERRQG
jgi:1-acyl-sn-glycerol-3-phosphate acyltransferase